MKEKLMRVSCEPECGFMVQSHAKKEMINIVKMHAKNFHKMEPTDNDILSKVQMV